MWRYRYTILYTARAVLSHPDSPASSRNDKQSFLGSPCHIDIILIFNFQMPCGGIGILYCIRLVRCFRILTRLPPLEMISNHFSGVLATSTCSCIQFSTKFILAQKFFCYKCYISIDTFIPLFQN